MRAICAEYGSTAIRTASHMLPSGCGVNQSMEAILAEHSAGRPGGLVEVNGDQAKLYLGNNSQPSLIVNDLKHGASASGAIGLWVDVGTEGFFSDLKVQKDK